MPRGSEIGGKPLVVRKLGCANAVFGDRLTSSPGLCAPREPAGFAALAFGEGAPVLYGRQRHSVISYTYSPGPGEHAAGASCVGECDALLTATPGVVLAVQTADCLPVVVAGGGVAAMIHAGWRGLSGDVLGRVMHRLDAEWGVAPDELDAVIGPGIGVCHYPVGDEVREALARVNHRRADWCRDGAVDLARWAEGRFLALGLSSSRVELTGVCTWCSPDHHSFRRDGPRAGRQWSGICVPVPTGWARPG